MDEDGAVLRNYENKTFHYPQPKAGTFETGQTGENCRWSARERTLMILRAPTAIRTATVTPHGATAAVEMRTTCDEPTRQGILPYQQIARLITSGVITAPLRLKIGKSNRRVLIFGSVRKPIG